MMLRAAVASPPHRHARAAVSRLTWPARGRASQHSQGRSSCSSCGTSRISAQQLLDGLVRAPTPVQPGAEQ
eukprot:5372887-Prymnesium_polylepis.1